MKRSKDTDRLLISIAATILFHMGLVVGLGFVDFSRATVFPPIVIDLGSPAEVEPVDPPATDDAAVDEQPEQPQPEPDEPPDDEELLVEDAAEDVVADEPPTVEETPAEEPATPPSEAPTQPSEPAQSPPPAAPREPVPGADAFSDVPRVDDEGVSDRESLRAPPSIPEADAPDSEFTAQQDAARRQFLEFEERLMRQEERVAELDAIGEDTSSSVSEDASSELDIVTDRLARMRDGGETTPTTTESTGTGRQDASPEDGLGSDDIDWESGNGRRRVSGSTPAFTAEDIRVDAPEIYLRVSFSVNSGGSVEPASVRIDGQAALTSAARLRLEAAVMAWRFSPRPGAPTARGSIEFIIRRGG